MAVIKCKMCGGDIELSPDKTFGVCECCGSTMTFPKVDDDQRAAAFNRGNYFRRIGEFDKALAVYERIVEEDNTDAEAHWCCALCRYGIEYVEDPTTHEYLPTCHRASFDNFLEDVDYQAALQYSDGITKRQYEKDAAKIAEVQHGILATCQNEQPFDVFICYKESDENGSRTKDSTLAQEIYYQLTDQGRRVFFARITLEDKVGTEYEPYIFAALNSAKVMVVVGTKPEYFNAVWVKNEWSRFLAMMKKDRSKLLLPCYRDMDPYDLPEALAVLQSYDMSKIGFMQDLTRGISKVLDTGKQPAAEAKETVVVQNVSNTNVTAQIKRGNMALADGEWEQAKTFFNQALDMDAECAEAYLGLALAEEHYANLAALQEKQLLKVHAAKKESVEVSFSKQLQGVLDDTRAEYSNKIVELCDLAGMAFDMEKLFDYSDYQIQSALAAKQDACKEVRQYYAENRNISKAIRFAKGGTAQQLKEFLAGLNIALEQLLAEQKQLDENAAADVQKRFDAFIESAKDNAERLLASDREKLEASYQSAQKMTAAAKTPEEYKTAAGLYQALAQYKDAPKQAELCTEKQKALEVKKQKKTNSIVCGVIAAVLLVGAAYAAATFVIIPQLKYKNAEKLYDEGQYLEAQAAFTEMGDYKDSEQRAEECHEKQKEVAYDLIRESFDNGTYNNVITDWKQTADDLYEILSEKGYSKGDIKADPYYAYCKARAELDSGNKAAAYGLFKIANVNDSADYLSELEPDAEAAYQTAVQAIDDSTTSWDDTISALTDLGDYRDAPRYLRIAKQCKDFAQFAIPNGVDNLYLMVESEDDYMEAYGTYDALIGTYCKYISVYTNGECSSIDCENADEARKIMQKEAQERGGLYKEYLNGSNSRFKKKLR